MYCTKKITDDLTWVGGNDRRLAMFEGVYSVPDGVSYNSYLLMDDKTVLFDTVDKAVTSVFFENIAHVLQGRSLDYVVVQHMEPDHSATLAELMLRYPQVQIICNANDEPLGQEEFLLSNATALPLEKAVESARAHGAVVYPAHVDRQANGILTTLGGMPPSPVFTAVEYHDGGRIAELCETHSALAGLETVICSDAHYLWDINEAEHCFLLDDEPYSSALVRRRLLDKLAGKECGI